MKQPVFLYTYILLHDACCSLVREEIVNFLNRRKFCNDFTNFNVRHLVCNWQGIETFLQFSPIRQPVLYDRVVHRNSYPFLVYLKRILLILILRIHIIMLKYCFSDLTITKHDSSILPTVGPVFRPFFVVQKQIHDCIHVHITLAL